MKLGKLENVYYQTCKDADKLSYFHVYQTVKERLSECYFPYLHDVLPFYTDHGALHIDRIEERLYGLLKPHLPRLGNPRNRLIDAENLSLLMHAVLWHDVGNMYGRADHARNMVKLFDQVAGGGFLYDEQHRDLVKSIAKGHSGTGSIEQEVDQPTVKLYDYVIYPRFLCALLRFADELDEDRRRVQPLVKDRVPDNSKPYWFLCECTDAIVPGYVEDFSVVKNIVKVKARMTPVDVHRKLCSKPVEMTGIQYYVARLEKMNEERKYCNPFLAEHSALYFTPVDTISLELDIRNAGSAALMTIPYDFNDKTPSGGFFKEPKVAELLAQCKT